MKNKCESCIFFRHILTKMPFERNRFVCAILCSVRVSRAGCRYYIEDNDVEGLI